MLIFFEMNPLKVEFFDCDQYLYTIDDLVQQLLEVLEQAAEWTTSSQGQVKFKRAHNEFRYNLPIYITAN